jgi:arginyl-tRNA synthetase
LLRVLAVDSQGVRWATKHSKRMHSQRFIHSQRFTQQLQASDPTAAELSIELTATKDEKFGDYQISSAMAFAKKAGKNPRQVAEGWLAQLQPINAGKLELEIAGPGFINVKLTQDYLYQLLDQFSLKAWDLERPNQTVVVDYSSPNVAKEMHVGHIRSTILGDSIARILEYGGDRVLRQNHLGDWGTQFGMLCALLQESESDQASSGEGVGSLEGFIEKQSSL